MADDFLQGAQVGGNLVSQGWQRQERMMELRARAAQDAIRERESVARLQVLLKDQEMQEQEFARKRLLGEAGKRMMLENKEKFNLTDVEALGSIIAPITAMDAEAGLRISQAYENAKQGMMAGRAVATTPHQKVLEEQAAQRIELGKERLKEREARLAAMPMNEADKAKIRSIYKRVDALTVKMDEMGDETSAAGLNPLTWRDKQPNPEKAKLAGQIKALEEEAAKLAGGGSKGAKSAPAALKLGAIVMQGGKRYRYQGGPVDDPASFVEVTE